MPLSNINYSAGQDTMLNAFDKTNDAIDAINDINTITSSETGFSIDSSTNITSPSVTGRVFKKAGLIHMSLRLQGTATAASSVTALIEAPVGYDISDSTVIVGTITQRLSTGDATDIVRDPEDGVFGAYIDTNKVRISSGSALSMSDAFIYILNITVELA